MREVVVLPAAERAKVLVRVIQAVCERTGAAAGDVFLGRGGTKRVQRSRQAVLWVLERLGWPDAGVARDFRMDVNSMKKARAAASRNFALESLNVILAEVRDV